MAKRNRETLKNFFRKGQKPSEEQFIDLIDSSVNIVDEGFAKSVNQGLELCPIGDSSTLISLFKKVEDINPYWRFNIDSETGNLIFSSTDKQVLSINSQGKVGVNSIHPNAELDVNGMIASKGRLGTFKEGMIPADGKWHNILENLDGCFAFELVAGVGKKKSGKYALISAQALTTFKSRSKIRINQAYYHSRCNKIRLKWGGDKRNFHLKMKTNCSYGSNVFIKYNMSKLWLDHFMEASIGEE